MACELFGDYHKRINSLTFFLEACSRESSESEKAVSDAILAFRLYKSGYIFSDFMWWGFGDNALFQRLNKPSTPDKYRISESEFEKIKLLFNTISASNLQNDKHFRVVMDRFDRTYEERRADDKIIDYAIALEALFFYGNKTPISSAGQFVGVGCSMLLGKNREEREEINEFLVKAFEIRNKIVHGSDVDDTFKVGEKEYTLDTFAKELQDYMRQSIKKLIL
jgi:hypothetical protein